MLAAVHISGMPASEQITVFASMFNEVHFSAVLQFYAAITKLRTLRPLLSLVPRFLRLCPASIYDLVRKIIRKRSATHERWLFYTIIFVYSHCRPTNHIIITCMCILYIHNHCICIDNGFVIHNVSSFYSHLVLLVTLSILTLDTRADNNRFVRKCHPKEIL